MGKSKEGVEADWFGRLQSHLGEGYFKVAGTSLMYIRMAVFVRRELYYDIVHVKKDSEATGIGNMIGNKGAVAISFQLNESRFCFVGSHLAAHQTKVELRNANVREIVKGIKLKAGEFPKANEQTFDITHRFHYLFWCGDLNYRIDMPRENVLAMIQEQEWDILKLNDQLLNEKKKTL